MSAEFTITSAIKLANGKLQYASLPTSFTPDQGVANGPSPGAVTATTAGVTVTLTQLSVPAITRIMNCDPTNYVTVGLYISSVFYPFAELLPGESYVLRLSRTVLTAAAIRLVANTANCNVLFECFDK